MVISSRDFYQTVQQDTFVDSKYCVISVLKSQCLECLQLISCKLIILLGISLSLLKMGSFKSVPTHINDIQRICAIFHHLVFSFLQLSILGSSARFHSSSLSILVSFFTSIRFIHCWRSYICQHLRHFASARVLSHLQSFSL